ncbi:MAG TPA: hypothetical protein VFK05_38040 [Polyangiaceae bacterium]|nr:hypothetical protein [Polyangiaceae bacterium]
MREISGFAWLAVVTAFIACSGKSSSQAPLFADAGPEAGGHRSQDAGDDLPDAGQTPVTGCRVDADCSQGVCDANSKQCVECRVDASCGNGERCKDGHCADARPCTAGTYTCDGHTLFHCSADGELEFSRDCAKNEYCDPRRAQCQPQICKPSVASCDGAKIQVCNDEGSELVPKQLCSLGQVCSNGECLDIACVPNTSFCSDGNVWKCGPDGTTSEPSEHCPAGQYCLEKDHAASCSPTLCFAGDAMCVGNSATQCKPDGSGPKPGGSDCGAANQTCYQGECRDPVCTPGLKLCDQNSLYLCSEAGTGKTLISKCGEQTACDPTLGVCQPRICEAGKLGCDGTRVVTCNPLGTGWLQSGPDCAENHALCSNGSCKPIICSPSQYVCQGDSIYQCSADGTSSAYYSGCGSGAHCALSGTYAYCSSYYCQPSTAGCNGNFLTTCKADGSGWASGGTDCSLSNAVCASNQCKPMVCTPSALFCQANSVQQCDYQGLGSYQTKLCGFGTYCKAQGTGADCIATPCVPDSDGCLSEKYGHCAADGMSLESVTSDCAASSNVCTQQGCAATAVDTIANPTNVDSYYSTLVNFLDVQSSRKLTTIEVYLTLPATRTLTFLVYQKSAVNTQQYDLKFQKSVTATGSGFQSSGAISYKLEANNTYAIGVSVAGGSFVSYYEGALSPVSLSFASVKGGYYYSGAPSGLSYAYPNLSQTYHQRLTTSVP